MTPPPRPFYSPKRRGQFPVLRSPKRGDQMASMQAPKATHTPLALCFSSGSTHHHVHLHWLLFVFCGRFYGPSKVPMIFVSSSLLQGWSLVKQTLYLQERWVFPCNTHSHQTRNLKARSHEHIQACISHNNCTLQAHVIHWLSKHVYWILVSV